MSLFRIMLSRNFFFILGVTVFSFAMVESNYAYESRVCPMVYDPVCGINGTTYPNDCVRSLAGVGKRHNGSCRHSCTQEGESLGALVPGNQNFCCAGLEPFIPHNLVGIRGTCERPQNICELRLYKPDGGISVVKKLLTAHDTTCRNQTINEQNLCDRYENLLLEGRNLFKLFRGHRKIAPTVTCEKNTCLAKGENLSYGNQCCEGLRPFTSIGVASSQTTCERSEEVCLLKADNYVQKKFISTNANQCVLSSRFHPPNQICDENQDFNHLKLFYGNQKIRSYVCESAPKICEVKINGNQIRTRAANNQQDCYQKISYGSQNCEYYQEYFTPGMNNTLEQYY